MLAEIFMIKMEAMARAAEEATTRFHLAETAKPDDPLGHQLRRERHAMRIALPDSPTFRARRVRPSLPSSS